MLIIQNKIEDEGKILERDPRLGARVICRSLLPSFVLLGTIQRIIRYRNGAESWKVLTDGPMIEEGPSTGFLLYEGSEFRASQQVKYHLDEGGSWLAMVIEPEWACDHLRFLILIESDEHAAVKVEQGHTFAADPTRLSTI